MIEPNLKEVLRLFVIFQLILFYIIQQQNMLRLEKVRSLEDILHIFVLL